MNRVIPFSIAAECERYRSAPVADLQDVATQDQWMLTSKHPAASGRRGLQWAGRCGLDGRTVEKMAMGGLDDRLTYKQLRVGLSDIFVANWS